MSPPQDILQGLTTWAVLRGLTTPGVLRGGVLRGLTARASSGGVPFVDEALGVLWSV